MKPDGSDTARSLKWEEVLNGFNLSLSTTSTKVVNDQGRKKPTNCVIIEYAITLRALFVNNQRLLTVQTPHLSTKCNQINSKQAHLLGELR
jgi:hypothetical protein